jgi:hypothetical protein
VGTVGTYEVITDPASRVDVGDSDHQKPLLSMTVSTRDPFSLSVSATVQIMSIMGTRDPHSR